MSVEQPDGAKAPADCCPPARDPRIASHFDSLTRKRTAGGALPPMQPVSQRLFQALGEVGERRPTVLELGCGSGALAVALLGSGAQRAHGVDLSREALATARRRADEAGVGERLTLEEGDAAKLPISAHDWVVMDRVICCYPDVDALLANALPAARERFCFSVPTSRGMRGLLNRFWWGLEAWWTSVARGACPGYVHSLDRIEGRLRAAGFRLKQGQTSWMWYVAIWDRTA